jgi:hypothetical protein
MNGTGISGLLKRSADWRQSAARFEIIGGNKFRSLFEMTGLRGVLDGPGVRIPTPISLLRTESRFEFS